MDDNGLYQYVAIKEGERGLANIEEFVSASTQGLDDYIKKSKERLMVAATNDNNYIKINRTIITRKHIWKEKQMYEYFKRQTSKISHAKTWKWLRKGNTFREIESFLIAAHDNAIRINYIKSKIDKTQQNSKCRLWRDRDETINHVISECSKLAQKEYKTRHDWVGKVIHGEIQDIEISP